MKNNGESGIICAFHYDMQNLHVNNLLSSQIHYMKKPSMYMQKSHVIKSKQAIKEDKRGNGKIYIKAMRV